MKGKALFLKNAAVLTAASLILKTAGMVLRVWLSSRLLGEGLGLYQLIFSVYLLASKPLTAGFETAVTKIAGDGRRRGDRVVRAAFLVALPVSVAVAVGVGMASPMVADYLLCDQRAALSLQVMAFSIPFMALSAVLKGYFISRRNTLPQSATQLLEQGVRMGAVILLVSACHQYDIRLMCAAVLAADCIAEAASFAAIYIWAKLDMRKIKSQPTGLSGAARGVCGVFMPVAGERAVTTAFHTAENLLVPTVAAAVVGGREVAVALFGVLKGMALPLLFFPSSFLGVFSTLLIPEIAQAEAQGQRRRLQRAVSSTLQIIITFSVLLAAVFFFFADYLGILIYNSRDAAYMIRILAPIVPFMYCEAIADGMMKGMGLQVRAFWSGVTDAMGRIALVFLLVPRFGMDGFLMVMIASNVLAGIYKVSQVLKRAEMTAEIWNWIIKPTTAAVASGAVASALCGGLGITNNILYVMAAGGTTLMLFFGLLTLWGTFNIGIIFRSIKSGS